MRSEDISETTWTLVREYHNRCSASELIHAIVRAHIRENGTTEQGDTDERRKQ